MVTVIVAEPTEWAVIVPLDTEATEELLLAQVTAWFVALAGWIVAVNISVPPTVRVVLVLLSVTPVTGTLIELTVTAQVA